MLKGFLFFAMAIVLTMAHAQTQEDPLKQTQDLLRNQEARKKALDTPEAQKAADRVSTLSQGDKSIENGIWDLSADLMSMLNDVSGGDPKKMQEFMEQAKADPKSFAERFPAAQREKLRQIAEKLSQKQKNP